MLDVRYNLTGKSIAYVSIKTQEGFEFFLQFNSMEDTKESPIVTDGGLRLTRSDAIWTINYYYDVKF